VHSLRVSEEGVFVFQCVFVFFVIEAAAMHCVNLKRALNFVTMRGMYSRMHVLYLDISVHHSHCMGSYSDFQLQLAALSSV
jgi:hypothetical protein